MNENDNNRRGRVPSREELLKRSQKRSTAEEPLRKKTPSEESKRRVSDGQRRAAEPSHGKSGERHRSTEPQRRKSASAQSRPSADGRPRKKRKKKNKLRRYYRLILVLAVFAVILIPIFGGIINLLSGSKGTVRRAYAKTMSLYSKRPSAADTVLGKDVTKLIKRGNYSQSFTLGITDNTADIKGLGLSGEINKNTSAKTADIQFSAQYNDANVMGLKMFTDNKQVYLSAPGLYDSWLSIDCDKNVSQLSQSALGKKIEFSNDKDLPLKMFSDDNNSGETVMSLGEQFGDIFTKQIDRLSKKADYTKIKGKKPVLIDGTEKRCRGYEVKINGDDLKNFLVNTISEIRKNKKIRSYLTNIARIQYKEVIVYQMLYDSPDYLLDDYYKKIDDTLAKINAATFTDTKANIYIYKGVIANMEFSTVYAIDKDMMNIELSGGMYGGRRPYEDLGLKIKLSDEKRTLQASYGEETDNIDKTYTHKKIFEIGDGEKDLTLNSKVTYDKSTGVINGGANLKTPSGGYIDLNGSGKLQKSGGVTSIEAQEIKLDYNNLFTLIMNGSYRVGTLAVKPQKPAGDTVDLFAADEAQLNSIMDTILGNVEKISSDANKVLTKLIYKPNETNGTEEQKTGETTEASDGETTETTTGEAENSENTESGGSDEAA